MQTAVKENRELKAYRARHGLGQKEFSDMVGIAYSTYVQKENGNRKFTQDEMKQIKEACDLTSKEIEDIFF